MPLNLANAKVVLDRDTHAIILTRAFAAPRERVFEAWTLPEHVKCWWDPTGEPLAECEIDLRPGGAFRFVNQRSPAIQRFEGVYREIAPPRFLIFDAKGATGRINFEGTDGKTLLTVRIECGSAEQFEQYLKMGIGAGTARTLENLAAYVGAKHSWTSNVGLGVPIASE